MPFAAPLLDLAQAQALAGEADALRSLVESFRDSLQTELLRLDAAAQANDGEDLSMGLHALKGFVSLFCGTDLAQALTHLYQDSRQQSASAMVARYRALEPALRALHAEVEAWLGAL